MAARSLKVPTTRRQREIVPVALDMAKKLAQDVASGANRLGIPDGPANNILGNLAFIRGEFDKILPAEQGMKPITLEGGSAAVLKDAIRIWAAATLKKDHALQLSLGQGGKTSATSAAEKAMQDLLTELNEQLNLPFEPILAPEPADETDEEFAEGTADGPHRGVGTNRKPEDTPEGRKKWDRTHAKAGKKK